MPERKTSREVRREVVQSARDVLAVFRVIDSRNTRQPRFLEAMCVAYPSLLRDNVASMEVRLSPDKEAKLHDFANRSGKDAAQLVEEAVDRMLEYDARFVDAVEEGRSAARRGELLEHGEVVARVGRILTTPGERLAALGGTQPNLSRISRRRST
jgi:predicted transcriptional regulator